MGADGFRSAAWPATVDRWVVGVEGAAGTVASVVVLADLIGRAPLSLPGAAAFAPALLLVFPGQLWMILVLRAGGSERSRGWREPRARDSAEVPWPFRYMPPPLVTVLGCLLVAAWVSAMTADLFGSRGQPDGGVASCPYRLSDHGVLSCVSRAEYAHAGADEQRAAASVLLCFFVAHTAIALSDLRRRQQREAEA